MPPELPGSSEHLRLLIVEDHRALADNIFEYLGEKHYSLDFAYDGLTALHLVSVNPYDVIVLDIMLPGISGLKLCERIRNDLQCNTPILFMTARDTIEDKATGFSLGGDDYLVKPFNIREMELRIQALSRRGQGKGKQDVRNAGSIHFDSDTQVVFLDNGKKVELSGANALLFEALMKSHPRFVSHGSLSQSVWGIDDIDIHTLRTHIYNLRKLLNDELDYSLIKTLRGRGYRLIPPEEE